MYVYALVVKDIEKEDAVVIRMLSFGACNVLLFFGFSVLWVRQYHMSGNVSDTIDEIVVPWLWLAGFFVASFFTIRRPLIIAIPVAVSSAVTFAGILFLFIHIILVPIYDPMF